VTQIFEKCIQCIQ